MLQFIDGLLNIAGKTDPLSVSVEIAAGSVYGLFGASGSGRSSIIRMLCQQTTASTGQWLLDGTSIEADSNSLWKNVGYVPQGSFLPPDMTVEQILEVFQEQSAGGIDCARFNPMRQQSISSLSGGERRFLEVMGVLGLSRRFYIMDEPFRSIQPIDVERISDLIVTRKKAGAGFLITDQYYRYVLALADQAYVLSNNTWAKILDKPHMEDKLIEIGYIRGKSPS